MPKWWQDNIQVAQTTSCLSLCPCIHTADPHRLWPRCHVPQHRLNVSVCIWICRVIVENSPCSVPSWLVYQYVNPAWKLNLQGLYVLGLCCSAFSILSPVFCHNTKSTWICKVPIQTAQERVRGNNWFGTALQSVHKTHVWFPTNRSEKDNQTQERQQEMIILSRQFLGAKEKYSLNA